MNLPWELTEWTINRRYFLYALENTERTRKSTSLSIFPEFCTAFLYFMYSALFLLYVPLSLEMRLFHSKSPYFAPSQSHVCFYNTTFYLADYSLALTSSLTSPLRRGNSFLHPFSFLSYLILGVPP